MAPPKSTSASQFQWRTLNLDNPIQNWLDESEREHLSPTLSILATSPWAHPPSKSETRRGCLQSESDQLEFTAVRGRPRERRGLQGRRDGRTSQGGREGRKGKHILERNGSQGGRGECGQVKPRGRGSRGGKGSRGKRGHGGPSHIEDYIYSTTSEGWRL